MKRCIFICVVGLATVLLASDASLPDLERNWNRRSFTTTMIMMSWTAQKDGKVTDEELMEISKAGFALLEPHDSTRKLVSRVESEESSRVVFVALDDGVHYTGFHFWFSRSGKFEKLMIAPSM